MADSNIQEMLGLVWLATVQWTYKLKHNGGCWECWIKVNFCTVTDSNITHVN